MTRFARRQRMMRGDTAQNITLKIERLTLEGVSCIEGQRIVDSLTTNLSRTLEGHELPEKSRQVDHETIDGPPKHRALPEDVGADLARIVARQMLS